MKYVAVFLSLVAVFTTVLVGYRLGELLIAALSAATCWLGGFMTAWCIAEEKER